MKNPCKTCFVQACCTEPCREYATYLYEIRQFEMGGKQVTEAFDKLPRQEAIQILLSINKLIRTFKLQGTKYETKRSKM